jgi:hypothetical protein
MVKKIILLIMFILLTIPLKICKAPGFNKKVREERIASIPVKLEKIRAIEEFNLLRDSIGYKESSGDWTIVNKIGCIGWFQFKIPTLHSLGYHDITLNKFRKDPGIFPPKVQNMAFEALIKSNWILLEKFNPYIGTVINGVKITKSGLLAAAHLGGAANVMKYLFTNGEYIIIDGWRIDIQSVKKKNKVNARDINGTSIADYIREFAGYNI